MNPSYWPNTVRTALDAFVIALVAAVLFFLHLDIPMEGKALLGVLGLAARTLFWAVFPDRTTPNV